MTGVSAIRVSDVEPERVEWLWRGRIPIGKLVTLDGMPGLGKSTVTHDIAARVSTGRPMPGEETNPWGPASVVLLSAEDGIGDTIRPRLEAAGADLERIVVLDEVDAGEGRRPPIIPDDLGVLFALLDEENDVGLVVIDPLFAFLSGAHDSHRDQDVRRVLHQVKILAERAVVPVLVVRHPTKGSAGGSAIYAGGGSVGIVGAARVGLFMGRDPDDDECCVLACAKNNLAKKPPSLSLRLVEHDELGVAQVRWQGESRLTADQPNGAPSSANTRDQVAVEIMEILAGHPGMSQAEVIRALNRPPKDATARRALDGLVKEGDLEHGADGKYRGGVTLGVSPDTPSRAGGYGSIDTTTIHAGCQPDTPRVTPPDADTLLGDMYGPGAPS
jgi:hypothetical protein